jgi:hypothetical protein
LLRVNFLKSSKDLVNLDCFHAESSSVVLVVPSPVHADFYREVLITHSLAANTEVITISRLTHDLAAACELEGEILQKAELMLRLATIWKIKHSEKRSDLFFQAYDLISELRSYSTNLDLFEEALEKIPRETAEIVRFFWLYMQSSEILDEHAIISKVADSIKTGGNSFELAQTYVFCGFGHLNGNQIDLIKSLGVYCEVVVPYLREIFERSRSTDYIRWLHLEAPRVEDEQTAETCTVEVVTFPPKRLAETLKTFQKMKSLDDTIFVCADRSLSIEKIAEIPIDVGYFKAPVELFNSEIVDVYNELLELLECNSGELPILEITSTLKNLMQEALKGGKQNFRKYKVLLMYSESFEQYAELSEVNEKIGEYDLSILKEVIELDTPRVYQIQMTDNAKSRRIYDLQNFRSAPEDKEVILCVTSDYSSLLKTGSSHSFDVRSTLGTIGPIRNPEVEFLESKSELLRFIKDRKVTIFLEAGIDETDVAWKDILKEFELKISQVDPYLKSPPNDGLCVKDFSLEVSRFSASRLQTYKECPRKYFYQYVDKVDLSLDIDTELGPSELGELEHAVIQKCWECYGSNFMGEVEGVATALLRKHISEKNKQLSESDKRAALDEIEIYATNGLNLLKSISEILPKPNFEFEKSLKEGSTSFVGFVDCLVTSEMGNILLDFKRSGGSIPGSVGKLFDFEKIQLWFYLERLGLSEENLLLFGYVNLSNIDDSLLVRSQDNGLVDSIIEQAGEHSITLKVQTSKHWSFPEAQENYREYEEEIIQAMKQDRKFIPRPMDGSACTYCPVSLACPRREVVQ